MISSRQRRPSRAFARHVRVASRSWALAAALCALALCERVAWADEPFVGTATGPSATGTGKDQKRDDALLLSARRAAFATALDALGSNIDPELRKSAKEEADLWTRAYRVIRDSEQAGKRTVEVEVEIDLARLRKRVAGSGAAGGSDGLVLDTMQGCGIDPSDPMDRTIVATMKAMIAAGVLATNASRRVKLSFVCDAPAGVEFTTQVMQSVQIEARIGDEIIASTVARGFATNGDAAREQAISLALASLGQALVPIAKQRIVLRVEHAQPAAKIRAIERALREAVIGVRSVALVSIDPKGSAIEFEVAMDGDVTQLRDGIARLKEPTFALSSVTVTGPRRITASL